MQSPGSKDNPVLARVKTLSDNRIYSKPHWSRDWLQDMPTVDDGYGKFRNPFDMVVDEDKN